MTFTSLSTKPHKDFEAIKHTTNEGIEYWNARELMSILGYQKWSNFEFVIQKAQRACFNSNEIVENHFADISKMVQIGSNTVREVKDWRLDRYACYLIAQNGNPQKRVIANAQTYFATQTRKQEVDSLLDEEEKRLFVRGQVKEHNKNLFSTAKKAGVINFGHFNEMGYKGLYNGMTVSSLKSRKGVGKDDILDRAGITELAANLFRITQTDEKIQKDNIQGQGLVSMTHFVVGSKVRDAIKKIGGTMPEDLPAEPHIKELEKHKRELLKSNQNKLI